jgi:hypothetical protein
MRTSVSTVAEVGSSVSFWPSSNEGICATFLRRSGAGVRRPVFAARAQPSTV